MSDWNGKARSNYFRVKDEAAFRAWAAKRELGVERAVKKDGEEKDGEPRLSVYSEDEFGGWPSIDKQLEAKTGDGFIDFAGELALHLQEGEIAVLQEIGAEKLRYLTGVAIAVDHAGKEVTVDLDDIYRKAAAEFGVPLNQIPACSY